VDANQSALQVSPSSFSLPRVRSIPRPATSPTVQHLSARSTRKPPDVIVRMLTKPGHRHSRLEKRSRERKSKCISAETRTRLREREKERGTSRQWSNYATCLSSCAARVKRRMREAGCRDTIGAIVVKIPTERSKIRRIASYRASAVVAAILKRFLVKARNKCLLTPVCVFLRYSLLVLLLSEILSRCIQMIFRSVAVRIQDRRFVGSRLNE